MKVKLAGLSAGPAGVFPAGSVVDLPDQQARQLIASGQAEAVDAPVPNPEPEQATSGPEEAATEKPRRRKARSQGP